MGLRSTARAACEFDVAVVTNITHEHLDYHGSWENYRNAKAILFEELAKTREKPQGNPRLAVLNKGRYQLRVSGGCLPAFCILQPETGCRLVGG